MFRRHCFSWVRLGRLRRLRAYRDAVMSTKSDYGLARLMSDKFKIVDVSASKDTCSILVRSPEIGHVCGQGKTGVECYRDIVDQYYRLKRLQLHRPR